MYLERLSKQRKMSKYSSGHRSRKILDIIQKNITREETVTKSADMKGEEEVKRNFMFFKQYPKLFMVKSLSVSNLTIDTIRSIKKRGSSVPPSFKFEISEVISDPSFQSFQDISENSIQDLVESPSILPVDLFSSNIPHENNSEDEGDDYADSSSSYKPSSPSSDNDDENIVAVQESSTNSQNVFHGDLTEGRKRRKNKDCNEWKKLKNKKLRMEGKSYLGYTKPANSKMEHNKVRPPRQIKDRCKSKFCERSQNRNCKNVSDESRQLIFKHFWDNLNWDQKKVYIASLVKRTNVSRKTSNNDSRRGATLHYFLPLDPNSNTNVQVCRNMFLNTFCLGSFTVQTWVKMSTFGMIPSQEVQNSRRAKSVRRGDASKLLTLNSFLDDMPKLPSHYRRKETTKLYLEPSFRSMADLYNTYKKYCSENAQPTVCRFTFEKAFNDKNLSIYTVKKDMCDVCTSHAVGNLSTEEYERHIDKKNRARREKEEDKARAARGEIILLTMDLEAVKVCPYLTASSLYFKTKLTSHNFTVYNAISHHTVCYWFVETAADLTASTFTSFIVDYLERFCLIGVPIIIFSDGCTYQNRNNVLSNALIDFSMKYHVQIEQKFLEPGHTQMECDSVHSAIERKLKNREIHLPSDYISLTREARIHPFPYETVDVDYSFVKNYASASTFRYSSIRPGRKAGDPTVTNIRAIRYTDDGNITIKLNFDADWIDLPTRPKKITGFNTYEYLQMNNAPLPITTTKFNHLQSMKSVLPSDCHTYYDTLPKI